MPPRAHVQVQSAAELQHLLACHPNRLLVLHFAAAGCPLSEVREQLSHAYWRLSLSTSYGFACHTRLAAVTNSLPACRLVPRL